MWIKIEFDVEVWGKTMHVEVSQIAGGAGYWHLYIDRFFWGSFVDYGGRWELRLHIIRAETVKRVKIKEIPASPPWWFTMAEMRILEDMIEEKLPAESRPQVDFVHFYSFHGSKKI